MGKVAVCCAFLLVLSCCRWWVNWFKCFAIGVVCRFKGFIVGYAGLLWMFVDWCFRCWFLVVVMWFCFRVRLLTFRRFVMWLGLVLSWSFDVVSWWGV